MLNFKDYAEYYNLLYYDKNYQKETDYIEGIIKQHFNIAVNNILDVGCGTGKHDFYLSEKGYYVLGIDSSEEMIAIANENKNLNLSYSIGDAKKINLKKKFDAVISLFHVASYQITNEDLLNYLRNIYKHLKKDGLFIFDFWYGPAVLSKKPEVRIKRIENDKLKIVRIAEPFLYPNKNIVDVKYSVYIENKQEDNKYEIKETHKMRYFFIPEIIQFLEIAGFKPCAAKFNEWMTGKEADCSTWGVSVVVVK